MVKDMSTEDINVVEENSNDTDSSSNTGVDANSALKGLLSSITVEDGIEGPNNVVLSVSLLSSISVDTSNMKESTIAELYKKFAIDLGIEEHQIVAYKANNELVSGDTLITPGTKYLAVIRNQHKGCH